MRRHLHVSQSEPSHSEDTQSLSWYATKGMCSNTCQAQQKQTVSSFLAHRCRQCSLTGMQGFIGVALYKLTSAFLLHLNFDIKLC